MRSIGGGRGECDRTVPAEGGLDPAQIKYVIVQHGHFDHFGGAQYLQDKYKARILMAAEDWASSSA